MKQGLGYLDKFEGKKYLTTCLAFQNLFISTFTEIAYSSTFHQLNKELSASSAKHIYISIIINKLFIFILLLR